MSSSRGRDPTQVSDILPPVSELTATLAAPEIPKVEIRGVIGRGGMGAVWRGRHTFLNRDVAVKTLLVPAGDAGREFVRRFEREARILASLSHPHVVGCHDAGMLADGSPYLVMEYISGPTLKGRVENHGPMSEAEALRLAREMAEGLAHAHAKGIIHRDVKPENVLLAENGESWSAKLVDLGLARPQDAGVDTNLTMAGGVVGTPATMAPEQFSEPDAVDARADMYGLGCSIYYALTGVQAFSGNTIGQLVSQKLNGTLPDLATVRPDVSPATTTLIHTLLAKERERRPPTWAACIALIEAARMGSVPLPEEPGVPWRRAAIIGTGLAIAAAVALVAVTVFSKNQEPRPALPSGNSIPPVPASSAVPVVVHPIMAPQTQEPQWGGELVLFPMELGKRLGGWDLAAGARWDADPDQDEGIAGFAGSLSRALPGNPWRMTAVIDLTPLGELHPDGAGIAVETDAGCLGLAVRDVGATRVTIERTQMPGPQATEVFGPAISLPRPILSVTMAAWGGQLHFEVDGQTRTVPLASPPKRLHLWALSESASRPVPIRIHHLRLATSP